MDGKGAAIGYGGDVLEIILEGQGFPTKGMLDGFGIDISSMQADTCANAGRVRRPAFECSFIVDGIDSLSGTPEG